MKIEIEKSYSTEEIPSGSGISVYNGSIFIVGDDVDFIKVILNQDGSSKKIFLSDCRKTDRIAKLRKHDLEASLIAKNGAEDVLFAFGSGSYGKHRDSVVTMSILSEKIKIYSLRSLYASFKEKAKLKDGELNIEGATMLNDHLLLFNRGKNLIFGISWESFTQYLSSENSPPPTFTIADIPFLPKINGFQVGLSGVCTIDEDKLLFTASLEETSNFFDDGDVKGSYIGIMKLETPSSPILLDLADFKSENEKSDKLESIDIIKKERDSIKAIAVADNDDGTSRIFYLNITL